VDQRHRCPIATGKVWSCYHYNDITERKKAEEALQQSQLLFKLLPGFPCRDFRTDPDGNTTYVNPKWTELSGLSSEEASGNGWLNAVHRRQGKTF